MLILEWFWKGLREGPLEKRKPNDAGSAAWLKPEPWPAAASPGRSQNLGLGQMWSFGVVCKGGAKFGFWVLLGGG